MKRILCCFHMFSDPDHISQKDWEEGIKTGHVDTSYIKKTINAYDESALELALRYKDLSTEECELTAISIGDKVCDNALKTLAALGFSRTVRIEKNTDDENLTSEEITGLLLAYIRKQEPYNVIMTGVRSGDGNQGKLPILLAEALETVCITNVTELRPSDAGECADAQGKAEVSWETDESLCRAKIGLPAVLAVGTVASAYLRVPTLMQRMKTKDHEIEIISADSLTEGSGNDSVMKNFGAPKLIGMEAVDEKRDAVIIEGKDPAESAGEIFDRLDKWTED